MYRIARFTAVGALLLAAGCGGVIEGRALPAAQPARDVGSAGNVSGVTPCDLLTPAQLDELGLGGATARPVDTGPARSCQWSAPGSFTPAILSIFSGVGLETIASAQGGAAGFTESEVAGYPALSGGGPGGGDHCGVLVGLTEAAVLSVLTSDGCDAGERMAALAIANLP
jgi:hypothetical protein